jgi:hypothetical protein
MKYNNKFYYSGLLNKIFNKSNLKKILIMFILGFISRIFINNMYNINILSDYLQQIFVIFYFFLSFFILFINEFFDYFYLTLDINHVYNTNFKHKSLKIYTMNSNNEGSSSNNNGEGSSNSANSGDFERPKHKRIIDLRCSEKMYDSTQDLALQEKEKAINKYKEEFKEFYTTNRDSIKHTNEHLEKLTIKIANKYYNTGSVSAVMEILPIDLQPLYKKFLRKQLFSKVRFSSTR